MLGLPFAICFKSFAVNRNFSSLTRDNNTNKTQITSFLPMAKSSFSDESDWLETSFFSSTRELVIQLDYNL